MHRLMEMLSEANVNYSETNFDDKHDLEQLVHPYVCHNSYLSQKIKNVFLKRVSDNSVCLSTFRIPNPGYMCLQWIRFLHVISFAR